MKIARGVCILTALMLLPAWGCVDRMAQREDDAVESVVRPLLYDYEPANRAQPAYYPLLPPVGVRLLIAMELSRPCSQVLVLGMTEIPPPTSNTAYLI